MSGGKILIGQIAFVDKGVYNAETTYGNLHYVTTEDSTYLSLKDNNVGNPITDPLSWKCLADGKPSTEAANLCKDATGRAIQATSHANEATTRLGVALTDAGEVIANTTQANELVNKLIDKTNDITNISLEEIANMQGIIQQVINYAQIVPTRLELIYSEKITIGNPIAQSIVARLYPKFVTQNTLFQLEDGDSIRINPIGAIKVLKAGKTTVYATPTHNISLMQTVEIEVVEPACMQASAASMLLVGSNLLLI